MYPNLVWGILPCILAAVTAAWGLFRAPNRSVVWQAARILVIVVSIFEGWMFVVAKANPLLGGIIAIYLLVEACFMILATNEARAEAIRYSGLIQLEGITRRHDGIIILTVAVFSLCTWIVAQNHIIAPLTAPHPWR